MTALHLAVFDMDGTLIDSQAAILGAMASAFDARGAAPPPRAAVLGIVGLSLPVAIARLVPEAEPGEVAALAEAYRAAFLAAAAEGPPPLYPGARELLETLAARPEMLLGIATGKSRRGLEAVLAGHGLAGLFVTTQTADGHPSKPHPAMLEAALRATGIAPGAAAMIGDTSFDVEMAQAAAVPALAVTWGYHPTAALARADATVARMAEVPGALDRLWGRVAVERQP